MKRLFLTILTLFLILINTPSYAASKITTKELSVPASDKFNIKATLTYPKDKTKKEFKTVVLLHSLGTNSDWWLDLPQELNANGYAVLKIDLRGHGASIYNAKLNKVSWKNLTNNAYAKYPKDVLKVLEYVKTENPKLNFFNEWAIVGSDIGGSAGVLAADKFQTQPKTIVILSPVVETKGLYLPIALAQLDKVDFFTISSCDDKTSQDAEKYLKKFAQKEFVSYTSTAKSSGMVMLKNEDGLINIITAWIAEYLKD